MEESALVERYLLLGLRLGRLIPGLVDAYYGPPELSARVEGEEPPDAAALAAEAQALLAGLDGTIEDEQRARWLRAQLVGLETVARRLAGEVVSYPDEVERCYGVRPSLVPEEAFAGAHEALDEVLPGQGPVHERYLSWERAQTVNRDALLPALEALTSDLRERTRELVSLPDGEAVELELVQDEPWLAFNYYQGDLKSRAAFNTDLPWPAFDLFTAVAHELYPGHHTEAVVKERHLVSEQGRLEAAALLIGTPQSLIAEAIATLAPEIVSGDRIDELSVELLAPLGIAYDPETAAVVRTQAVTLAHVATNAALLLHDQGRPLDEVRAYARRWSVRSDETIDKGIRFITDETWRAYVFCYTAGLEYARRFVDGDHGRFRRLLTEQMVAADLNPTA
jgi:hypothetical protein